MKTLLKIEEAAGFVLGMWAFYQLELPFWYFWAFLLAPDLGALGYLVNPKIGAWSYNLFHHKAVAIALWILGWYLPGEALLAAGALFFAHSCMDRVFGYGLKYLDDFKSTHLGRLK